MIKIGDKVAYNVNFLRYTRQEIGEMPFRVGTVMGVVLDIPGVKLLNVLWNDGIESTVNEGNLTSNTCLDATIGAKWVGKQYNI